MNNWNQLASEQQIKQTISALKTNGISAMAVSSGKEAKKKALEFIPKGSEVMTMSSVTLETIGLNEELNKANGQYKSVKQQLMVMDRHTQKQEMNRLGAAPDFAIGSIHALTEAGQALIASATGSQLPAYAYGSSKVIWIVGSQKIVKNTQEGMARIYEYVLPLEDAHMRKLYGVGSGVNKLLIVNYEKTPARISVIIVREQLGF
jgi:hypothetical protein